MSDSPARLGFVANCVDCRKAFGFPNRGGCELGRALQAQYAERGEHDCAMFKPIEVIARERKRRERLAAVEMAVSQESLF